MARILKQLAVNGGVKKPQITKYDELDPSKIKPDELPTPKVDQLRTALVKPLSAPVVELPKEDVTPDADIIPEEPEAPVEEVVTEPVVEPETPSVADEIRAQSDAQTQALVQAIRQRISESKAQQQRLIEQAPQVYDPLRAESEVRKAQELRSALERSSVLGDRGGIGRSEALATQTAGEKRLTDINLQQQNFIDNANAEIARLENEGLYKEAEIVAQQKAQLLQDLLSERVRQEGIQKEETALERQQFIDTLGRFGQDFTAEIQRNQNDGDPSNDWQIPLLEQARQEKIVTQGLDPLTGQPLPQVAQLTPSSAMDLWEQTGVANEAIANALGINVGERFVRRGGTGGVTSQGLSSVDIRYKLSNGIPLNAQEAAAWGVEPGYVLPVDEELSPEEPQVSDTFVSSSVKNAIDVAKEEASQGLGEFTTQDQSRVVSQWLVDNAESITPEQGQDIMDKYGLTLEQVQQIISNQQVQDIGTLPAGQTLSPFGR